MNNRLLFAIVAVSTVLLLVFIALILRTDKNLPVQVNNAMWSSKDPSMIASTINGKIVITWNTADDLGLYWRGSFPTELKTGERVISATGPADRITMKGSLLASQDVTKTFTLVGDDLTFELSIMGVTKTVHLVRK